MKKLLFLFPFLFGCYEREIINKQPIYPVLLYTHNDSQYCKSYQKYGFITQNNNRYNEFVKYQRYDYIKNKCEIIFEWSYNSTLFLSPMLPSSPILPPNRLRNIEKFVPPSKPIEKKEIKP